MSKTITVSIAVALFSFGMVSDACQTPTILRSDIVATKNPAVILPTIIAVGVSQSANAVVTPEIKTLPATPQTVDAAETPEIRNAVVDPAATPRNSNAATTPQTIDAAATPQTKIAAAIPPTADAAVIPQIKNAAATPPTLKAKGTPIKNAAALLPTTQAGNWQYWEYCLALSEAEHKIYFSKPIPVSSVIGKADDLFDSLLNKAGLAHDAVQCPRAPNKPTLLFRQKYAITFNEKIGRAIVDLNWEDID